MPAPEHRESRKELTRRELIGKVDWLYHPRSLRIGKLDIEISGMGVRRFGLMLPDGLHVWWGSRGVHLFWHCSPYAGRVTFDREEGTDDQ